MGEADAAQKILVVDADLSSIRDLLEVLRSEGYDVTTATGGKDAMTKASQVEFWLIVIGEEALDMPYWQLMNELALRVCAHRPYLFLLYDRSQGGERMTPAYVGHDFGVPKPVIPLEVLHAIQRLPQGGHGSGRD